MDFPYTMPAAEIEGQLRKARNNQIRVFDWARAAHLIKEHGGADADAGLGEDWGNTSGAIYRNHAPVEKHDTFTYLASKWATPVLHIAGKYIECYLLQAEATAWDARTYWPASALKIILGDN